MGDELGSAERIDRGSAPDPAKRTGSVGTGVTAMRLKGLGVGNRALSRTPHGVAGPPLDRWWGPGIPAAPLNAEGLGRPVEALDESGGKNREALRAIQTVQRVGLGCRFGHWATTRVHPGGQDNRKTAADAGVGPIPRGYSRDHRPELTQGVRQLIGERPAGLPRLLDPRNGNPRDSGSFGATIKAHRGQLQPAVGRA